MLNDDMEVVLMLSTSTSLIFCLFKTLGTLKESILLEKSTCEDM